MRGPMKLGFFTMPIHPLDKDWRQSLREDREAFVLADELGFVEGYVRRARHRPGREHHLVRDLHRQPGRRHQVDQARHRHDQHAEHASRDGGVADRDARPSCSTAGSSSASARAGCCRTPRCSAISMPTATRCSSRRSTRCWRSGRASRPTISRASTGRSASSGSSCPNSARAIIAKPLQKPHPPIVVTAVAPFSKGVTEAAARGWDPISANFLMPRMGQEPLAEIRRGLRARRPAGRSGQLAGRQEHLRRRRREDREGLRDRSERALSLLLQPALHQAEDERPHRAVQDAPRSARRRSDARRRLRRSSSPTARPTRSPTNC